MTPDVEIRIAYDSVGKPEFETGWGFSAVVSRGGRRVLFDCGWDGRILRRNLARMGISFGDIDAVVISHAHWDHLSGLTEVLSEREQADGFCVFFPDSFSSPLKKEISKRARSVSVKGPVEVVPGVMSTGELGRNLTEQSLVVPIEGGSVVLTGCAHPGLGVILERASSIARPTWLLGGLHGAKAAYLPGDLDRLVLCHCTREKNAMMAAMPGKSVVGMVGDVYRP